MASSFNLHEGQSNRLPTFDSSGTPAEVGQRWKKWFRSFEYMAEGMGISDTKRLRSLLLHSAGPTIQDLFDDLTDPEETSPPADDDEFKKASRMLSHHFKAEPNPIYERHLFRQLAPKAGESISQFVVRLRQQARFCDFGDVTNDMIRDHVVATMRNVELKKKLLQESKLTLATCLEICAIFESTQRQASAMGSDSSEQTLPSVNAIASKASSASGSRPGSSPHFVNRSNPMNRSSASSVSGDRASSERLCYRCNRPDHLANHPQCPARGKRCTKCRKVGHLASCCTSRATNNIDIDVEPEDTSESFAIGAIGEQVQKYPPITIDVTINDIPCTMEVDTGAEVSILPESVWKEKFSHISLEQSSASLHAYGGHPLVVKGECTVSVCHESHSFKDRIIVVGGSSQPLFGRNWMSHIVVDWLDFRTAQANALSLNDILAQFPSVFQEGLGTIKGHTATIHLQGSPAPRSFSARPVPYALKSKVEAELTRLQTEGVIKPVDHADWASPIVTVRKKNNSIRLCADFKVTINKHIEPNQHPIPNPTDLLSELSGGSVFSKLDLSQAYAQLPLDEQSQSYCVISTHKGLFAFTRLPFGVSSAPSIFQKTIEQILRGIPGVVIYFDDILISGKSQQEHDDRLRTVLQRFQQAGLRLSREKCAVSQQQVSYLGFTVSQQGIQPTNDKVLAIMNAPRPTDVSALRSFLGLVNFFGRFIPNCSTLLSPLNSLMKKDAPFVWSDDCETAFCKVKQFLATTPVMAHYDPTLPLVLECDASPTGIGAALVHIMPDQSIRPIVYVSRALSQAENHYSQIEREALAIVFAVRRLHQYLYGRRFILRTDHKPLVKIFGPHESLSKTSASRLQRWAVILAEYDYTIEHLAGKDNVIADCLSRLPLPLSASEERAVVHAVFSHSFDPCELIPIQAADVAKASKLDGEISLAMSYAQHGWPSSVSDRNTPHTCTKQSPSNLLFKKAPTTRLSLLQPSFASAMQQQHPLSTDARKQFDSTQAVWVHNARPGSKPKWLEGTVEKRLGPITYLVSVCGMLRQVHIDHLRARMPTCLAETSTPPTEDSESSTCLPAPTNPPASCSLSPSAASVPVSPVVPAHATPEVSHASAETTAEMPAVFSPTSPDTVADHVAVPALSAEPAITSASRYPVRTRRAPDRLDL
eukprot:scpid24912/ scgid3571/ Uncharacterized protein K02A2.6